MVFFQNDLFDLGYAMIKITGLIFIIATLILVPMYYIADGKNRDILQNLLAEVYNFDQRQSQMYNNYQY